jgi:hypothetical protein
MIKYRARYEVRFVNDHHPWHSFKRTTGVTSLLMAAEARVVAGDLVVDTFTGKVCEDTRWLWDWEKENPASYARGMMGKQVITR